MNLPEDSKPWARYHEKTKEQPIPFILENALRYVDLNKNLNLSQALDFGAGALRNSNYLCDHGFSVTALDNSFQEDVFTKDQQKENITIINSSFESFNYPENTYGLIAAMWSLPFIKPEIFIDTFNKIKKSLKIGGVFCGHFFGPNHDWATDSNMTFHIESQIRELVSDLEVLSLTEKQVDTTGIQNNGLEHWHVFYVIARKI